MMDLTNVAHHRKLLNNIRPKVDGRCAWQSINLIPNTNASKNINADFKIDSNFVSKNVVGIRLFA